DFSFDKLSDIGFYRLVSRIPDGGAIEHPTTGALFQGNQYKTEYVNLIQNYATELAKVLLKAATEEGFEVYLFENGEPIPVKATLRDTGNIILNVKLKSDVPISIDITSDINKLLANGRVRAIGNRSISGVDVLRDLRALEASYSLVADINRRLSSNKQVSPEEESRVEELFKKYGGAGQNLSLAQKTDWLLKHLGQTLNQMQSETLTALTRYLETKIKEIVRTASGSFTNLDDMINVFGHVDPVTITFSGSYRRIDGKGTIEDVFTVPNFELSYAEERFPIANILEKHLVQNSANRGVQTGSLVTINRDTIKAVIDDLFPVIFARLALLKKEGKIAISPSNHQVGEILDKTITEYQEYFDKLRQGQQQQDVPVKSFYQWVKDNYNAPPADLRVSGQDFKKSVILTVLNIFAPGFVKSENDLSEIIVGIEKTHNQKNIERIVLFSDPDGTNPISANVVDALRIRNEGNNRIRQDILAFDGKGTVNMRTFSLAKIEDHPFIRVVLGELLRGVTRYQYASFSGAINPAPNQTFDQYMENLANLPINQVITNVPAQALVSEELVNVAGLILAEKFSEKVKFGNRTDITIWEIMTGKESWDKLGALDIEFTHDFFKGWQSK
ncbi:MAG: hypothetical protein NZT61_07890, partial [Deltaproteobacteria bacterium]|nr:hypothetical protein [Deltaproteobacteria bacterium]